MEFTQSKNYNSTGMATPLSAIEVSYKAIQEIIAEIESQTH